LARYNHVKRQKRKKCLSVDTRRKFVKPDERIYAPVNFSLTQGNGVQVVKFLKAVAHRVLIQQKKVKLNFRKTKYFFVPGAILLFSEINGVVNMSTLHKPITLIDPYSRKPREVMKQIGIHELTGDTCNVVPSKDDVIFWKATKGATQSGDDLGPIIEFVTERANSISSKQVELKGLWRGVSEAVINAVEHAYKMPRKDGFSGLAETKWWMFTQIKDDRFSVAVCDLGCGYRNTINHSIPESFLELWRKAFQGENSDVSSIKIAMEYGRSGTKEGNRGKGSKDALSVLSKHGNGSLFILSSTGWVEYILKNNKEVLVRQGEVEIDVGGTIVWWNLPLTESDYDNS